MDVEETIPLDDIINIETGEAMAPQEGLNVQDAIDALGEQLWPNYYALGVFTACLIGCGFTLFFPGFLPGLFLALFGCSTPKVEGFVPQNAGMCYSGLTMVSVPGASLAAGVLSPLVFFPVKYFHNRPINSLLDEFSENAPSACVSAAKFESLGPYLLKAKPDILKKLNVLQALFLAKNYEAEFRKLLEKDSLSQRIFIVSNHFLNLIHIAPQDLVAALNQPEIYKQFQDHPPLFEITVQGLEPVIWRNAEVQSACKRCLKKLHDKADILDAELDLLIEEIRSGVILMNLEEEVVSDDESVTIKNSFQSHKIQKEKLANIADYFVNMKKFADEEKESWPLEITVPDTYPQAPEILSLLAKEMLPKINKKNLLAFVEMAIYFRVLSLTKACDLYVVSRKLQASLTAQWQKKHLLEKKPALREQLRFCEDFALRESKDSLIKNLLMHNEILDDPKHINSKLKKLDKESCTVILDTIDAQSVLAQVQHDADKLLHWAMLAHDFNNAWLKKVLLGFCEDPNNEAAVSKVLAKVIHKLRD